MANPVIDNSKPGIWTTAEFNQTKREARKAKYRVITEGYLTHIMDGEICVLTATKFGTTQYIVRYNATYFEKPTK